MKEKQIPKKRLTTIKLFYKKTTIKTDTKRKEYLDSIRLGSVCALFVVTSNGEEAVFRRMFSLVLGATV